ncbi:MAG: AAA family ATPase [Chromatiaceae bacterium]|nr:AAA family ATPase [Chromatiaceae bacterium]
MRIARFDLLRYGKFTDRSLTLPRADQDFHFIVGPNEAGKSTLRAAIQDLLFGIETRSRFNFLHPHHEMRLGARLEREGGQDAGPLDFIRLKARTNTLKTPGGATLPEEALSPFLGQVDRHFFDQMFGLDHQRLVAGGEQILNASNDIGRILFQAAAGIGGLGEIREQLEQEADRLWSKRKSDNREYYQASAQLEQAKADLDRATVRAKDWLAARERVGDLQADLERTSAGCQVLEQERDRLQRVWRIATPLANLRDREERLAVLGAVPTLPEEAGAQLARAERDIAMASQSLQLHEAQVVDLTARRDALHPDPAILERATEIAALAEQRQRLGNHERDIGRRLEEVRVLWQQVQNGARQLGWPDEDETALGQRLPGRLVRSAINELLRRHEALAQTLASAEETIRARQRELQVIDADLVALPGTQPPPALPKALVAARDLGNISVQQLQLDGQVARLTRDLDRALLALGEGHPALDHLSSLALPAPREITDIIQWRATLESSAAKLADGLRELRAEVGRLELETRQYQATHKPVTLAEVRERRAQRDATWGGIKAGALALAETADRFEQQIASADVLSDQRHDKAQEAAGLQARLDRLEQLLQQQRDLEALVQENDRDLTAHHQDWERQIAHIGLPGLPLARVESWRAARERVLRAVEALEEDRAGRDAFGRRVTAASQALARALGTLAPDGESQGLAALLPLAEEVVTSARQAADKRELLANQKVRALATLAENRQRREEAHQAMAAWRSELQQNLALAHLPPDTPLGALQEALDLFAEMHRDLEKIRELRVNRIDMMRRDLADFAGTAQTLARGLAPELAPEAADGIALALARRLQQETAAAQDRDRLQAALTQATGEAQADRARLTVAQATLDPLRQRLPPGADLEILREAIRRSDHQRQLGTERDQFHEQLLKDGDGLDPGALEAERAGIDVLAIPARVSALREEIEQLVSQQNQRTADLRLAEANLARIAGQDEAAQAEARRQEALARMGNAVERFVRVHTAAKLLRWSIERFREHKQGPLLARASAIFRGLTGGALERLQVDYDIQPPTLLGQRPNGARVHIEGMSEGTRDQLYLALRLAALELHLRQTPPLPFIADDLFINYDNGRARAGFAALADLSRLTQVIFLSHHHHLVELASEVFGGDLNVLDLEV